MAYHTGVFVASQTILDDLQEEGDVLYHIPPFCIQKNRA